VSRFAADLDITNLLRAILNHAAFQSPAARTGRVRTPVEWIVGAERALKITPDANTTNWLNTLQQRPFQPPNVAGWPSNGYWVNTASALDRVRIAQSLANAGDTSAIQAAAASARATAVADLLGVDAWSPRTAAALAQVQSEPKSVVALALVSPEYTLN